MTVDQTAKQIDERKVNCSRGTGYRSETEEENLADTQLEMGNTCPVQMQPTDCQFKEQVSKGDNKSIII